MAFCLNKTRLSLRRSATAQVLTKDLELLKAKLRHLLQYLNATKTKGLFYLHPKKRKELTEFSIFGDSSFAPSGKHSQSEFTVHLSYGNARHRIRWQSLREYVSSDRELADSLTKPTSSLRCRWLSLRCRWLSLIDLDKVRSLSKMMSFGCAPGSFLLPSLFTLPVADSCWVPPKKAVFDSFFQQLYQFAACACLFLAASLPVLFSSLLKHD